MSIVPLTATTNTSTVTTTTTTPNAQTTTTTRSCLPYVPERILFRNVRLIEPTPSLELQEQQFRRVQEKLNARKIGPIVQRRCMFQHSTQPWEVTTVTREAYLDCTYVLMVVLERMIRFPERKIYRSVLAKNHAIKERLLAVKGCHELLLAIGFVLNDNEYRLPDTVPTPHLQQYLHCVNRRRQAWMNLGIAKLQQQLQEAVGNDIKMSNGPIKPAPSSQSYGQRITFDSVLRTNIGLLQHLEKISDDVMQYEDEILLETGRSLIPIEELTEQANNKLYKINENIEKCPNKKDETRITEPCIRDLILVELVDWFNTKFMTWVNQLPCRICGSNDMYVRRNGVEDDVRVEVGICCGQETKFYRYNDVAQILMSRQGRCGEYANCFTFFCRCLDYDARLVHTNFDHVWTEVYSESQQRWLHVDPSDNVVDSPLMYQHGWKRSIDYVLAVSRYDVQDVTWRYTNNHGEILKLRNKVGEKHLIQAIEVLRAKRTRVVSEEFKRALAARYLYEVLEMALERTPTEDEKKGRSSGSLTWREERGEIFSNHFVFMPNAMEMQNCQLNVRYSGAYDQYERYIRESAHKEKTVISIYKTWQSAHFSSSNIMRKVENDWKMTYLARSEGATDGEIIWRFDFSMSTYRVRSMKMHFEKKIFGSAKIDISLRTDTADNVALDNNINGASMFEIKAKLMDGFGDNAWQHAQLFRQPISAGDFPFDVQVDLMKI